MLKYDFRYIFHFFASNFQFYNIYIFFNFLEIFDIYCSRKSIIYHWSSVWIASMVDSLSMKLYLKFELCSSKTVGIVTILVSETLVPAVVLMIELWGHFLKIMLFNIQFPTPPPLFDRYGSNDSVVFSEVLPTKLSQSIFYFLSKFLFLGQYM